MADKVVAQVNFTMTLMDSGSILMSENGMRLDEQDGSRLRYHHWYDVEGTVHPEELAYTLWAEMERRI